MSHWEGIGMSNEWYTPKYLFDALGCSFDLDVAGRQCPAYCVPSPRLISADSLSLPWKDFIWMYPPFGGKNGLVPWMEKFFSHGNGIALTPDRTSAPWFRNSWQRADLVMFTPKVKFLRTDGTLGKSPSSGTALWAVGVDARLALRRAEIAGLGIVAKPIHFSEVKW